MRTNWFLFGSEVRALEEERDRWKRRAQEQRALFKAAEHRADTLYEIVSLYENNISKLDKGNIVSLVKLLPDTPQERH